MTKLISVNRERLDQALVVQGLAATRSQARAMVLAGAVEVNGARQLRAGFPINSSDVLSLTSKPRYVSRGGVKLAHALTTFNVSADGVVAADIGASTGGFTDCLLQAAARRVYAIDVGYGQLDQRLRLDPRVEVMERTNARYLTDLPELVDLLVVDVSFISLALIFPVVFSLLPPEGLLIALIKPQFEAGRSEVGKGGVVRDTLVHRCVLERIQFQAEERGLGLQALTKSPLRGPAGNIEFLALFRPGFRSLATEPLFEEVLRQEEAG